ncbi:hypothetical protein [Flexivirga meconopsidis]|uniref:phosphoribosylanthranilate isomerase n=1 Tax=Flexivirga meconopsidis TaxID=2977121 RepID=UPI00223F8C14|nr:hypothetical protein [Flexivirga meconopsidis]
MTAQLKVCGATCSYEIEQASAGGADLVGLWWRVPGSPFSLPESELAALRETAEWCGVRACLVTFEGDAAAIAGCLSETGIRAVQLHAFQAPSVVQEIVAASGDHVSVLKVLHCDGDTCLDGRFAGAYARAGTSAFILDAVRNGRIGSTGSMIGADTVHRMLDELTLPVMLAGGLGGVVPTGHDGVLRHPRFAGVDVDGSARDCDGLINAAAVQAVADAWTVMAETRKAS